MPLDNQKYLQKVKTDWDRRAKADSKYWVEVRAFQEDEFRKSAKQDSDLLLDILPGLNKNAVILDLGCGIGRMVWALRKKNFQYVYGVDVSHEMIKKGKEWLAETNCYTNCLFVNNGLDLSFLRSESFDLVYSFAALQHMPKSVVAKYFQEVCRTLKIGGHFSSQFWIGTPNEVNSMDTLNLRVYSNEELKILNENLPFHEIKRIQIDYLDPVLKLHPQWVTLQKSGIFQDEPGSHQFNFNEDNQSNLEEKKTEVSLFHFHAKKLLENKDISGALRMLDYCIETDSEYTPAYFMKGDLLIELGKIKEGLETYEKILNNKAGRHSALIRIAEIQFSLGKLQKARDALKTLLEMNDLPEKIKRMAEQFYSKLE